jgi:hypothetical protein
MNRGQFTSLVLREFANPRFLLLIKSFFPLNAVALREKRSAPPAPSYTLARNLPAMLLVLHMHAYVVTGYSAPYGARTPKGIHIPFHHHPTTGSTTTPTWKERPKRASCTAKKATGILTVQLSRQLASSPPPRADASSRRSQRTYVYVAVASRPFAASARPRGAAPRSIRRRVV